MAKHRFQKGQSGNPNGRPKGSGLNLIPFREIATPEMAKAAQASLLYHLRRKNVRATLWFYEQMNGKAPQPLVGEGGGAININLNNIQWHKLSLEDLARYRKHPELLAAEIVAGTN